MPNNTPAEEEFTKKTENSSLALLPFAVFLGLFIGTGVFYTLQGAEFAFYQLPANIAIIPAILLALLIGKKLTQKPLSTQINQFIQGVGQPNIMTMGLIYLLAGAFAAVAKATGSVDASVLAGLGIFPEQFLLPGIFIVSALLSLSMGTSMGTIAAIAPIALGFIEVTELPAALMAGCIISGAMFGDNLSVISDTTIAATQSQGAQMKDKLKMNLSFALPAALVCLIMFSLLAMPILQLEHTNNNLLGLTPYLLILVLAIIGINVFLVLVLGIISAACVGFINQSYSISAFISDINTGFASVQEIFILALFIGGLSELIKQQGGLALLTEKVEQLAKKLSPSNQQRSGVLGIAGLAFVCNFFTANNTVSIIVSGETAKTIAKDSNLSPAQSASLLDVFACINQGLIPYGAQALLLGASLSISPIDVIFFAFYPISLLIAASIFFTIKTKLKT